MGGTCSTYEEKEKSMVGFGDIRSLGRPRRGWEVSIITCRLGIRREYQDWLVGTNMRNGL